MKGLLGNRVLLRPLDLSLQKTDSGIFVPDHCKRWLPFFEVVGLGPGVWLKRKGKPVRWIAPEVKLGDYVVSRHWQNEIEGWHRTEHDERQTQEGLVICDARYIIAILEIDK
jgi:co-chaperonin GroES (HSP10)